MTTQAHRTAADVVGRSLAEAGIEQVFGVVGSGNFIATSALIDAGASFVAARHEAGAAMMADGYGRASGKVAVASVHQGPGLTNALTALTESVKNRVPLVLLCGDTSDDASRSNFAVPQAQLVELLGAGSERLTDAAAAADVAKRAVARAVAEQRPIVLNLPLDVQQRAAPRNSSPHLVRDGVRPRPAFDHILAVLARARRPLILAGRGVWAAGCGAQVQELRERLGGLLATTAAGHGLFTGNPWSLGICGGFASGPAARLIEQADVVLGLGTSYTKWTTRHGAGFATNAVVVQVDHDPAALGLDSCVDLTVEGDVEAVVTGLLTALADFTPATRWDSEIGTAQVAAASWRNQRFTERSSHGRLDPRTLSLRVDRLVPAERTVVIDGGHFIGFPAMYWSVPDPAGHVFTPGGFQSIGLGLGAAIGAAIGRPRRTTILAIGDGGLHMSIAELDTLARLRLPLVIVVYNDAAYGAEVHHFRDCGHDLAPVQFPDTDFAAIAAGFGIEAATVRAAGDLDVLRGRLLGPAAEPLLLDCKVNPEVVADYQAIAFTGH